MATTFLEHAGSVVEPIRTRAFGRVTSSGYFVPQMDGLRCLSMLLVLGHHVFAIYLEQTHRLGTQRLPHDWGLIAPRSPLVMWALHLAFGVQLFCVISGFVLTIPFALSYLKNTPPPLYKTYMLRRLIRLEPPYVLCLIFLFIVIVCPPWHHPDPKQYFLDYFHAFAPHLLASFFYLHGVIFGQASWINGVAWTLEIEVQFYLLLPFLARLFRIRRHGLRRAALLLLILGSALLSQFVIQRSGNSRLNLSLLILLPFFLAGMLLADGYLDPPRIVQFTPRVGDVIALVSSALLVYVLHWKANFAWTEPLIVVAFCLAMFRSGWTSRLFRLPVLTAIGAMSYTVYLYHFFIVHRLIPYTVRLFPPVHALWWDSAVQYVVVLVPVLAISAVLFLVAEKPFMILSQKLTRRRRASPASVTRV